MPPGASLVFSTVTHSWWEISTHLTSQLSTQPPPEQLRVSALVMKVSASASAGVAPDPNATAAATAIAAIRPFTRPFMTMKASEAGGGRAERDEEGLGQHLPAGLVSIQLPARVVVHRMVALGNLDLLVFAAERRREVALTRVVDDGDDRVEVGVPAGQLQRGGHVAAARDAAKDPFLGGQAAGRHDALVGGRGDDAGQERHVQVARYESVADAFDAMGAPLTAREQRALGGLDRIDAHRGIARAQVAADTGERATAALGIDEGADAAVHLLPDLRARREHVRLDVVAVVELPRHPVAIGRLGGERLEAREGQVDVALSARGEDQRSAVGLHDLLALLAHALGHDDGARITLHRGDPRAGDAGVARRALEHAHAAAEVTARLGALEHVQIDAVLETAGRAVPLDLHVDGGAHV